MPFHISSQLHHLPDCSGHQSSASHLRACSRCSKPHDDKGHSDLRWTGAPQRHGGAANGEVPRRQTPGFVEVAPCRLGLTASTRASGSIYTTHAEVDLFLEAVADARTFAEAGINIIEARCVVTSPMVKNTFVVEVGDTRVLKTTVNRLRSIEGVFDAFRVTPGVG